MTPTLSIITPCFNRVDFIETAVESVLGQWREGMEHIIMDGGSTDGTLDRLQRYDHLTVISEPDENLYDAVNKGIARAKGDVVGWLNSDDRYLPDAFTTVLPIFDSDPSIEMVCGGASLVTLGAEDKSQPSDLFNAPANKSLEFSDLLFHVPVINARFFRRSLFERVGPFDLRYMPASDREFLIRCAIAGTRCTSVDGVLHEYVLHSGSATIKSGTAHWQSMADVHLAFAEAHMANAQTPDLLRKEMRSFHAKNALIGAVGELAQGHLKSGLSFIRRGWSQNAFWPFLAAYHSIDWAHRRARAG